MAALQSRALASIGWTVLQIDLQGCGDSEADFGEATWQGWIADAADSAAWLGERCGRAPWLWGLRSGCLVATAAAASMPAVGGFLFWQPVLSGEQFLRQFLRLKLAADLLPKEGEARGDARSESRGSAERLRERLLAGSPIEVAGYELAPVIAAGLGAARIAPIERSPAPPAVWIEVTGSANPAIAPASRAELERWRSAGHAVDACVVTGPAFWQTQEIEESPELIRRTLAALASFHA